MGRRLNSNIMKRILTQLIDDYIHIYRIGWQGGPESKVELISDFVAHLQVLLQVTKRKEWIVAIKHTTRSEMEKLYVDEEGNLIYKYRGF